MSNKSFVSYIIHNIINVIIVLSLAFLLSYSLFTRRTMQGHSMDGTINLGDIVFVNKIQPKFRQINRFDIICTHNRNIKRVIGLPGETIKISNGNVYINENLLLDYRLKMISNAGLARTNINILDNEYFVIGDNYDFSEDSRNSRIGNIKKSEIEGIVWLRIFPLKAIGVIK